MAAKDERGTAAMSTRSLTDRILLTGAVGITLAASIGAVIAIADLTRRVHVWRSWAHLDQMDQWLGIPLDALAVVATFVIPAGVWLRLVRRRNVIRSLSEGVPCPLTPRSKYAVWSPDWRSAGRPAVFGTLRTRKRVRRSRAVPTPRAASVHVPSAAPQSQPLTRR